VGAVYAANYGGISYSNCVDPTTAADRVTCFSNSASFLSLLAPGALITAGGYTMAGTSQATPHVSGAIAVLRAAFPGDTANQALARLRTTGTPLTDPRNGVTTPRINLAAASVNAASCSFQVDAGALSFTSVGASQTVRVTTGDNCAWTAFAGASWLGLNRSGGTGSGTLVATAGPNPGAARSAALTVATQSVRVDQAADTTPPTGSIAIRGGRRWTNRTAVTLGLFASDTGGVAGMCLSSGTTCAAWQPYATSQAWSLDATPGPHVVRAWFRDQAGNVSAPSSAAIVLDQTPPVDGTLAATPLTGAVLLRWGGFSDPLSDVAGYTLVFAKGAAPASCAAGTRLYSGPATRALHLTLTGRAGYGYRVCATDGAGNVSTGVTATVTAPR
jgi:hypothetical protein